MTIKRAAGIGILCAAAAAANCVFYTIVAHIFRFPLFLDTVFSCALAFSVGLVPGLITALLTWAVSSVQDGAFSNIYFLCSAAEVALVCLLKPRARQNAERTRNKQAAYYWEFSALLFLYIAAALTVSVTGGLVDFFQHQILGLEKPYFSPEDTFKMGLVKSNAPALAAAILSRLPINLVDRAVTIFGGYLIGRLINTRRKIVKNIEIS